MQKSTENLNKNCWLVDFPFEKNERRLTTPLSEVYTFFIIISPSENYDAKFSARLELSTEVNCSEKMSQKECPSVNTLD